MKKEIQLFLLLSFFLCSTVISAQQADVKRSNNKVSLNGKPYYIHIVRKGETLFAISQAYNVPVDTIKKDNLHISNDLKINQYLKIRVQPQDETKKQEFVYHRVKKGDTPYSLSIKYNVSINDIYEYNPTARVGIGIDEILKIPVSRNETSLVLEDTIKPQKPNNEDFIVYKVQKKETLFGIAAKYGTTQELIKESNPQLKDRGLQVDEEIKIPVQQNRIPESDEYYYHKVQKQETIYGLTTLYQIKEKQLYKLNPDLKDRTLQVGELIKIPKNAVSDSIFKQKAIADTFKYEPKPDVYTFWTDTLVLPPCPDKGVDKQSVYKIAFFLPLYLNINDTLGKFIDVLVKDDDGVEILETVPRTGYIEDRIYSKSKYFINFYQGALLALNDMKKTGISFEIHVFDTQNDSSHVSELLRTQNLEDFDLFIGPVYGDMLKLVGDYAWEHQINIVSPLWKKNDFIQHNPYAFQVIPTDEVQMYHASDYLNSFDIKNYIVIHDGNNINLDYLDQFKKQLFAQMNNENFDQIKYNEVNYYNGRDSVLKDVFTPGIKNIVIVPSSNQAFVTDVMGKLNGYSYEYDITTFGQPLWLRFENIELDNFHNTNTHLFSSTYIDYTNPKVIDFVKQYRYYYRDEPDQYAFQGYDVTKYFGISLNKYGKDFRKCIQMNNIDLLQSKFHFVPYNDQGGYQNTAIYILEYAKDSKLKKIAEYPR